MTMTAKRLVPGIAALLILTGIGAGSVSADSTGGFVRAGDSVSDVLSGAPSTESDRAESSLVGGWQLAGLGVLLVGLASFAWRLRSRGLVRRRGASEGGTITIVDRVALSPRHAVAVLRVSERTLVVGFSGDRVSPLAEWGGDALAGGTSAETAPERPESYWFRNPRDASGGAPETTLGASSGSSDVWDRDLAPYRREVTRLKEALESWRENTTPPSSE